MPRNTCLKIFQDETPISRCCGNVPKFFYHEDSFTPQKTFVNHNLPSTPPGVATVLIVLLVTEDFITKSSMNSVMSLNEMLILLSISVYAPI